jgi:hypothetical protein
LALHSYSPSVPTSPWRRSLFLQTHNITRRSLSIPCKFMGIITSHLFPPLSLSFLLPHILPSLFLSSINSNSIPLIIRRRPLRRQRHDGPVDALNVRTALIPRRAHAADRVSEAGTASRGLRFGVGGRGLGATQGVRSTTRERRDGGEGGRTLRGQLGRRRLCVGVWLGLRRRLGTRTEVLQGGWVRRPG